MKENEKLDLSIYFVSEEHKCVFALCYLDKSIRMELLGITDELYDDKKKAKEWYHRLAKIIHPDICKLADCEKAIIKLNELYAGMVKEDE